MSESEMTFAANELQACILAGGESSRMGRDKAKVLLGGQTLLELAQRTVGKLAIPCSVITEDVVPKCGPLGGIITGLAQNSAERVLLLPCDMPFVNLELIQFVVAAARDSIHGACVCHEDLACFPMVFNRAAKVTVQDQYDQNRYSLQKLVKRLKLSLVLSANPAQELFNINTEADLAKAERLNCLQLRKTNSFESDATVHRF